VAEGPLGALVLLELRRAAPVVVQTSRMGAGALVVLLLFGWQTPGRIAFVLGVMGLAGLWSVPMNVMRDKLEGGLEFLTALPVEPRVLAAARLLAVVIFALPAGAGGAAAVYLTYGAGLATIPALRLALWTFALVSAGAALAVGVGVGIALRIEARSFANLVVLGFLAVVAAGRLLARLAPHVEPIAQTALADPWLPAALCALLACLGAFFGWLAFYLARTGLERFGPRRDRITW